MTTPGTVPAGEERMLTRKEAAAWMRQSLQGFDALPIPHVDLGDRKKRYLLSTLITFAKQRLPKTEQAAA